MKTAIMITMLFFLVGCGGSGSSESSTTPPQPQTNNSNLQPPVSPVLE